MKIKELKEIVNSIPEIQDDFDVYVYEQSGNIGYAVPLERAYVGKTYTNDNGCKKTLQLQFECSNIIREKTLDYYINKIKKSINGEDDDTLYPVPHFNNVIEILDYLQKEVKEE